MLVVDLGQRCSIYAFSATGTAQILLLFDFY